VNVSRRAESVVHPSSRQTTPDDVAGVQAHARKESERCHGAGKELVMTALVVYESMYGNTRAIAEAVAEGLGDAQALTVHEASDHARPGDLLVVGGPTHVHGMASHRSREMAVEAAEKNGGAHVEPDATEKPGLREWLHDLPGGEHAKAAAFDTRFDKSQWVTGAASRGIAKRLRRRGYDIVSRESFLVSESEGPLAEGELDRAREWGATLATLLTAGTDQEGALVGSSDTRRVSGGYPPRRLGL
jgi:flavodoxin